MIDQRQTSNFPQFCADLTAAKSGNKALEKTLVNMGKEASEHLERVLEDAEILPEALENLVKDFTRQELDVIRKGSPFTNDLAHKIVKHSMTMAAIMGAKHPQFRGLPLLDELPNTVLLRFVLSSMVYMVHRIELGGFGEAKPKN